MSTCGPVCLFIVVTYSIGYALVSLHCTMAIYSIVQFKIAFCIFFLYLLNLYFRFPNYVMVALFYVCVKIFAKSK